MLEIALPWKTATVYTGHNSCEVDDFSASRRGRSTVFQARGTWRTDVGWVVGMRNEMAMTIDDFLLEFGIHSDVIDSEENSEENDDNGVESLAGV